MRGLLRPGAALRVLALVAGLTLGPALLGPALLGPALLGPGSRGSALLGPVLRGPVGLPVALAAPLPSLPPPALSSIAPVPPASAARQAALVVAEDTRLERVRRAHDRSGLPYRVGDADRPTVVLPARARAYLLADLLALGPQTLRRQADGAYLLSQGLVVLPGADLRLVAPGGLVLRLASDSAGFSTVVSLGGRLELLGAPGHPFVVTSWDAGAGGPDTATGDGRAYVRSVGGVSTVVDAQLGALGFWSGRTGGLALTGSSGGEPLAGTSSVRDSTLTGDAFGLFVSGLRGVQVSGTTVTRSLLDGIVLHRDVVDAVVSGCTVTASGGDGFRIERASSGVELRDDAAVRNGGVGYRIDGSPLASGPSAVGAATGSYGGNRVDSSRAVGNGRMGVQVIGGNGVAVRGSSVSGSPTGISVDGGAADVTVSGNTVQVASVRGIAVSGGSSVTVAGNTVSAVHTGISVRDSRAAVTGNRVGHADGFGVSLVGRLAGARVSGNVLAGSGARAVDTARASGRFTVRANDSAGWHRAPTWRSVRSGLLHPSSLLWAAVIALLAVSALRARRRHVVPRHPYAEQVRSAAPTFSDRVIDLRDLEAERGPDRLLDLRDLERERQAR